MNTEIEAKFINIDHGQMRKRLTKLGAKCIHPMRQMRRHAFDFPDRSLQADNAWARVRDEGDRVTMSFKQNVTDTLSGTEEVNLTVDNYENAVIFLEKLGLQVKAFQESKRETWTYRGATIELD